MEPDDALGDGEAKTGSATLSITSVSHPVKRTEQFLQRLLRHSGTMIPDGDMSVGPIVARGTIQGNLDLGFLSRVAQGIANDILDSATQELY